MIKLLRERYSEIGRPEVKHFQYVVVIADDTSPENVQAMIAEIVQIFVKHPAAVNNITSSLFVALLGTPFPGDNSAERRPRLVDTLRRENGSRIRIVPRGCDGAVGRVGGPKRWTCGAVIPGISGILKKPLKAAFGTRSHWFETWPTAGWSVKRKQAYNRRQGGIAARKSSR
jgi:hypothetical protein